MAKKPAEIPEHEQVILEPELEEALKNATDAEMCDIAGKAQTLWPEAAVSSGSRCAAPYAHSVFDAMQLGDLESATSFFDPTGPHLRVHVMQILFDGSLGPLSVSEVIFQRNETEV